MSTLYCICKAGEACQAQSGAAFWDFRQCPGIKYQGSVLFTWHWVCHFVLMFIFIYINIFINMSFTCTIPSPTINPAYKAIFSFPHALTPLSSHEFILKKQMCCDKHKWQTWISGTFLNECYFMDWKLKCTKITRWCNWSHREINIQYPYLWNNAVFIINDLSVHNIFYAYNSCVLIKLI